MTNDILHFESLLTAEEKLVQKSVAQYVTDQVIPIINDVFERAEFPLVFVQQTAQLGLLGMRLPIEYGGSAASAVSYGLACQELEKGDSGLRSFVSVQSSLCIYAIFAHGTEAQKKQWLPAMARGEIIGCFGLTEADAGSDPASMRTVAEATHNGWRLNGSKMWVTNAPFADIAIVWAKTAEGIRGFLVPTDSTGFSVNTIEHKLSMRASATGELVLHNVSVGADALLPGTEKGLVSALACLSQARYGIAWGAMGAAQACFEIARDYCLQRKQFNQPLASKQLVQQDLADMFSEITKAQFLNLQLGRLKDSGSFHHAAISLAKRNSCREALAIARQARNLLGGNGITLDYHVIRHLANLETVLTYEGTDNIHTLIIGKYLTGLDAF